MKVVNREEFMKMENVVFAKYTSIVHEEIMVKHGNCTEHDFFTSSLFGDVDSNDCGEHVDIYTEMENGKSHPMVVEYSSRDGLFDESEEYLVFEKEDLKTVTELLTRLSND